MVAKGGGSAAVTDSLVHLLSLLINNVSPGLDSTPIQDLLNKFSIKLWVTAGNFPSSVESQNAILHQA
eukprot:6088247-Ditylum_brightwellii.AAC.1